MVLFRETKVNEPLAYREEYVRLKIFTKEGVKYGNLEIAYEKGTENLTEIHGRTVHADGTIVNFDGKVFDKVLEKGGGLRVYAKTFSLPDMQPGSIIDYHYYYRVDERLYYIGCQEWSPQGELFARFVPFSILLLTGHRAAGLELNYRYHNLPGKVTPQYQPTGYLQIELHDIPGVEEEELMPPASAIRPRFEFFYRDPNEPTNQTNDQYWKRTNKKWDEELEKFVGKKSQLENEVSRVTNTGDPPETKLRKIYARVLQIRNLTMETKKSKKEQEQENLKPNSDVEDVLLVTSEPKPAWHPFSPARPVDLRLCAGRRKRFANTMEAPRIGRPRIESRNA